MTDRQKNEGGEKDSSFFLAAADIAHRVLLLCRTNELNGGLHAAVSPNKKREKKKVFTWGREGGCV